MLVSGAVACAESLKTMGTGGVNIFERKVRLPREDKIIERTSYGTLYGWYVCT